MMKRKIFILLIFLFLATPVAAQVIDRVVAVVNDEAITSYQLDRAIANQENSGLPSSDREGLQRQVLDKLIEEALSRQRIVELGIKVSGEELESAIQDVQRSNNLTREQLIEALRMQGMDFDSYRENLRNQILRFKLLNQEVQSKIDISTQDTLDYFRDHIDDYREPPAVHLARITFPLPPKASPGQLEQVRIEALQARQRLLAGEDFDAVLAAYTADGTVHGGDMGTLEDGALTPAVADAVTGLKPGEISELVAAAEAFHLIKVLEAIPGKIRNFDIVKDEIAKTLRDGQTDKRFEEWSAELRRNAYIKIKL